ncbi:MAG: hypothetical protein J5989_07920 [Alistipes sp.]|nr:hypothetical protein [Alistipes sp.]
MRTNNTIISLATLLSMVLVSSCTKTDIESELESTKSQLLYVTADIAKDAASRVSMEAVTDGESTTINLEWAETGETFDVIDANNIVVAKFKQTENTEDEPNKFVGQLTNAAVQAEGEYTIVYPSAEALDLSEQNGTLDNSKIRMCGTYSGVLEDITNVEFTTHKTAIIKLHFDIDVKQIRRVVVSGLENHILLSSGQAPKGNITINTDNQEDIYLNVPTTNQDTPIKFKVTTSDKTYKGTITPSKNIVAGKFYNAAITLNEVQYETYNTSSDITPVAPEGEGDEGSPYLIKSAANLKWLINQSNTASITGHYRFEKDFNIESSATAPWMFAFYNPFIGTLDGNDHEITGELHAKDTQPIIGFVCQNAGMVKNLNVDVEVVGSGALIDMMGETGSLAGGVVGANLLGTIDNCTSEGSITSNAITSGDALAVGVGGIAGLNAGTISNSTNNATVQGTNLISGANGWSAAAGIAGISADGSFENCHNTGNITAGIVTSGGSIGGVALAGGILGHGARRESPGIIVSNCTNSGTISGKIDNDSNYESRVGGIAGNITDLKDDDTTPVQYNSLIINCGNSGDIIGGFSRVASMIGGIIGTYWMVDITNCTNTATISAGDSNSESAAGGIAGWFTGDSHDSPWYFMKQPNAAEIYTTMSECKNYGQINGANKAGEQYIGGIIGHLLDGHNYVRLCENNGNINANGSTQCTISGVGGIIGRTCAGWASVYQCTNRGSLTDVAKVFDASAVGGISGICCGVAPYEINSGLSAEEPKRVDRIYDCVNEGKIIVPATQEKVGYYINDQYLGGVVGALSTGETYNPEVCSCCVDKNTENATNGYTKIGNNVALTDKCNGCTSTKH